MRGFLTCRISLFHHVPVTSPPRNLFDFTNIWCKPSQVWRKSIFAGSSAKCNLYRFIVAWEECLSLTSYISTSWHSVFILPYPLPPNNCLLFFILRPCIPHALLTCLLLLPRSCVTVRYLLYFTAYCNFRKHLQIDKTLHQLRKSIYQSIFNNLLCCVMENHVQQQ